MRKVCHETGSSPAGGGMRYATRSLAKSHARVPMERLVTRVEEKRTTPLVQQERAVILPSMTTSDPLVERKKDEVRAHALAEEDRQRRRDSCAQAQRRAADNPILAEQTADAMREAEARRLAALSRLQREHFLDDQVARNSELLLILAGDLDAPWLVRKALSAAGSTPEGMVSATLSGVTALSVSVASGHLESTRVLLDILCEARAPPPRDLATVINLPDTHGRTPLRVATDKGLVAVAELLQQRGALPLPAVPAKADGVAFTVDERVLRYVKEVEEARQEAEEIHLAKAKEEMAASPSPAAEEAHNAAAPLTVEEAE